MQKKNFKNKDEYYQHLSMANRNDDPFGILSNIYDNEFPHPFFDPNKIGFYRYRNYNHQKYSVRNTLPNKSIVFEDFEMYIPCKGDVTHNLSYDQKLMPLTDHDYIITSCITSNDHKWPVPYVYNNWHFVKTHEVNKDTHFEQLDTRTYFADVLLGNAKSHRTIFFELLRENNMLNENIIHLFGIYKSDYIRNTNDKIQQSIDTALTENNNYFNTTKLLDNNFTSQYISRPIVENSWISVVAETVCGDDNGCFFVTEKTAKPLMAGRPFIMLGAPYTLKHLQNLGFRTFDPVINENYDKIINEKERVKAAFESFRELSKQNPLKITEKLTDVLQHNRKIMYNKQKLTQKARNFLDNILLKHL